MNALPASVAGDTRTWVPVPSVVCRYTRQEVGTNLERTLGSVLLM